MKILDQNIQLSAQHYAKIESQKQRVHETFINGQIATRESESLSTKVENYSSITLNQQQQKHANKAQLGIPIVSPIHEQRILENQRFNINDNRNTVNALVEAHSFEDSIQLPPDLIKMIEAIESMMERLTGKPYSMKILGYESNNADDSNKTSFNTDFLNSNQNAVSISQNSNTLSTEEIIVPSSGERWTYSEYYKEHEHASFYASGHVTTEDGRQIQFDLNAQMKRNYETQLHVEKTQGVVFTDPLVVNFGGSPATLTVDKFTFDINSDGQEENISFVNPNSGFLVFDKNQDGVINNGSELFGTRSGDGFADLKQFDHDQNGWIDENDAIFSELQIWQKDVQGFDQLHGLLELNIGAIALQNIETPFALKDQNNQQHGQIISSGVFIHETGQVGSIQQIDLVI
ncbi:hypothetical protein [Thiomicrorhabdus lithotrophica]|uniref:VCBS repeat-containing protein n=1 Tax=Thiomicrorhabdus lithotrophica TaxID=2949997 RepID=A0ABY8CC39_9GAMM|nr:hypothetical protein [Thiomicrorhabdus lithotrophica]WEJ63539.1 hypothetical protein NR989_04610 [Thiomicrorhabdus lithotrophica]